MERERKIYNPAFKTKAVQLNNERANAGGATPFLFSLEYRKFSGRKTQITELKRLLFIAAGFFDGTANSSLI